MRPTFNWHCLIVALLLLPLIRTLGTIFIIVALVFTWRKNYQSIIYYLLNWGFALLSFLFITSMSFAFNRIEVLLGLYNFLPFFITFASFSSLIRKSSQLRCIPWLVVISSVPIVILDWGQLFWSWTNILQ